MKSLKKVVIIALCALFIITLAACSSNTKSNSDSADNIQIKEELTEAQQKCDKMWDLWAKGQAESPYAQMMTYQSEINNGGHDQYFINVANTGDLQKEMSILENSLSKKLKLNLKKAYEAYLILEEREEDEVAEEILEQCDDVFYEHEEEINHALESYAAKIEL